MAHSDKDLIDFPCSPTWAAFYAEQNLTADYPAAFYRPRAEPPARALEPDPLRQSELGLVLGRLTELTDLVGQQAGLIDSLLLELADQRARMVQQDPTRPAKVVSLRPTPLRPAAKPVEQVKAPPLAATPPTPPAPPAPRPRPILRGIDL